MISVFHCRRYHVVWIFLQLLFVYKLFYKLKMPSGLQWESCTSIRRMGGEKKAENLKDFSVFPDNSTTAWTEDNCRQRQKQCT